MPATVAVASSPATSTAITATPTAAASVEATPSPRAAAVVNAVARWAEHRTALGYPPVWLAALRLVAFVVLFLALVVTPPAIAVQLLANLLSD